MGRPKKSAPEPIEPEEESQEMPEIEEEAGDEPSRPGKKLSKAEAVRDALAHGKDSPGAGVAYIKQTHGIVIGRQMFSSYKTQDKTRQAKKDGEAARPARKSKASDAGVEGYVAPPSKARAAGEPDMLAALEGIKDLVEQYGAERLKRMVDLMG